MNTSAWIVNITLQKVKTIVKLLIMPLTPLIVLHS